MTFSILAVVLSVSIVVYAFYFVASEKSRADSDAARKSPLAKFAVALMLVFATYSAFIQWRFQREQSKQYRIHVRVLDSSNKPISDASIWIANLSKVDRSSDGILLVSGSQLPLDRTLQVFASSGYGESGAIPLAVGKSADLEAEIRLKQSVIVRGIVVDTEAHPVATATIMSGSQVIKADQNGTFTMLVAPSDISRGGLSIRATAQGAQMTERIYAVDRGPVTVVVTQSRPSAPKAGPSANDTNLKSPQTQTCPPTKQLLHDFAIGLALQIEAAEKMKVEEIRSQSQSRQSQRKAALLAGGESEEFASRASAPSPGSMRVEADDIERAKAAAAIPYHTQVREFLDALDASGVPASDEYTRIRKDIEFRCFVNIYGAHCPETLRSLSDFIK